MTSAQPLGVRVPLSSGARVFSVGGENIARMAPIL